MKVFTLLSLLFVLSCNKVEKRIKINATDYIANVPKDKTFKDKFIVLEFWATWCAPCIDAVPHLNELQEKFESNKDLIFVSITDEKPEKVNSTLKRIPFNSIVISDQTGKIHKDLNVDAIPYTLLIDNKGIVRWKGMPNELNVMLIDEFLKGKLTINAKDKKNDSLVLEKTKKEDSIRKMAFDLIKNKNIKYSFSLLDSEGTTSMEINALQMGKYVSINNKLSKIISDLEGINEFQIQVPDSIKNKTYTLIYNNKEIKDLKTIKNDIRNNILKSLNLNEKIEERKMEIYKLVVIDASKLEISKEINESNEEIGHSSSGKKILISNSPIKTLVKDLNSNFKIIVKDDTNLSENYNFILEIGTLKELTSELNKYGLSIRKELENEKTFIYTFN